MHYITAEIIHNALLSDCYTIVMSKHIIHNGKMTLIIVRQPLPKDSHALLWVLSLSLVKTIELTNHLKGGNVPIKFNLEHLEVSDIPDVSCYIVVLAESVLSYSP